MCPPLSIEALHLNIRGHAELHIEAQKNRDTLSQERPDSFVFYFLCVFAMGLVLSNYHHRRETIRTVPAMWTQREWISLFSRIEAS